VIVAAGPRVTPFTTTPYLIDMAPTMLAALDAPAGIKRGVARAAAQIQHTFARLYRSELEERWQKLRRQRRHELDVIADLRGRRRSGCSHTDGATPI